jgi:hypothetical protein
MADFATGGVIPPGSWVTFSDGGCELHVPPAAKTSNVSVTFTSSSLDAVFAKTMMEMLRCGDIDPGDGVLARV